MKYSALMSLAAVLVVSASAPALAWDNWGSRYYRGYDRYDSYYNRNRVMYAPPQVVYAQPVSNVVYPQSGYQSSAVVCRNSFNPVTGIVGGAQGGVAGNGIGRGRGRTAAIITGAVLGTTLGGAIGGRDCSEQVTYQPTVIQPAVQMVSMQGHNDTSGRYCREYQNRSTVGGRVQETYGTACMQPDGSWEIVD